MVSNYKKLDKNMANRIVFFFFALVTIQIVAADVESKTGFSLKLTHSHLLAPKLPESIGSPLMPSSNRAGLLAIVGIGSPPFTQYLIMDTGSSLTWVQRLGCTGCPRPLFPAYSPSESSTFVLQDCTPSHNCTFTVSYLDGAAASGMYAYEEFTFASSGDDVSELPNTVFGCANHVSGDWLEANGLLGLGYEEISMLYQSRRFSKFSYCIGNLSDPTFEYSKLTVGDGAILKGATFPLSKHTSEYYYVELNNMSIGTISIGIKNPLKMCVDSGTSFTLLNKSYLDVLKDEVKDLLEDRLREYPMKGYLCYYGNMLRDLTDFPSITLNLNGGDLVLGVEAAFVQLETTREEVFCLAFEDGGDEYILGLRAQQYRNLGFDLEHWVVNIVDSDCKSLV